MSHDHDAPIDPTPGDHAQDAVLDDAIRAARRPPDEAATAAACRGAWERIAAEAAGLTVTASTSAPAACAEAHPDLPALVAGTLTGDRAALVGDHCRECVACRRELMRLRAGVVVSPPETTASRKGAGMRRLLLPAGIAAAVAFAAVSLALRPHGSGRDARVAQLEGTLMSGDGAGSLLAEGAKIPQGRAVRTTRGSRAVIELPDGSRVEMNERAQMAFSEDGKALTVQLDRGDIIMAAAHRHERNLYVATADCRVAVMGTVFTVGHGLKGSRVGVLEGEVHVDKDSQTHVLKPGDQMTTSSALAPQGLDEQVAWSLSRDKWDELISEIAHAEESVRDAAPPEPRHESAILDAMPETTVFYAAMPNDGGMARLATAIAERVSSNPKLRDWWQGQTDDRGGAPSFGSVLAQLGRLSSSLGDEVVLAMIRPAGASSLPAPVVVAPVVDEGALRSLVREFAGPSGANGKGDIALLERTQLDGRIAMGRGGHDDVVLVVSGGHVLAGGPREVAALLSRLDEGPSAKVSTPFLDDLHQQYAKGTEILVAADVAGLLDQTSRVAETRGSEGLDKAAHVLGVDGVDRFLLTAGHDDPGSAVVSFRQQRSGMAAWLAEPAPMGSLEFVSPESNLVVAAVFRDPAAMMRDLDGLLGTESFRKQVEEFHAHTGVDLYEDVAAPLGGEMTIALDGPILPSPSWKVVMEVYDAGKLQRTIETLVARANTWSHEGGTPAERFSLSEASGPEGESHVLNIDAHEVHYAFASGYVVACPSAALLEKALQAQRMGVSIATSPRFVGLLPSGGGDDVSFLAFQDFASALSQVTSSPAARGILPEAVQAAAASGACLVHGRATDRAITFGVTSQKGGPGSSIADMLRRVLVNALARQAMSGAGREGVGYDGAPR